jgi:hypothetical protein
MASEKLKKEILMEAKKDPSIVEELCEVLELHSSLKSDEWPSMVDIDLSIADDDCQDEMERYAINFLKKVPAKYFDECELALQEVIELNEPMDDISDILSGKVDVAANDGPKIKTTSTQSQIMAQLKKAGASELIDIVRHLNSCLTKVKALSVVGPRQAALKAIGSLDKETVLDAILQEHSYFVEAPDTLQSCETVLDLILFVEDQCDPDLWQDLVDTLKLNKYKIPKARYDRDTEEREWLPAFLNARERFDFEGFYDAVESVMEEHELEED